MDVYIFIVGLLGLAASYLINHLADVLPVDLDIRHAVCHQADCGKNISWLDFLLMRRCPHCGKHRSLRSFLVLGFMVLFSMYLWQHNPSMLIYSIDLIVISYLLLVGIVDLEHRLVLRNLSILGLFVCSMAGFWMYGWQASLLGGLGGFAIMLFFYILGVAFSKYRNRRLGQDNADDEEALGSGDVTLAALLGLLLGWPLIWFNLLSGILLAGFASLIIIAVMLIQKKYFKNALMTFIPFGPFFIFSAFFLIHFPEWVKSLLS